MKKLIILVSFVVTLFTIFFYTKANTNDVLTIVLDVGHGGMDGGASVGNIKESELTLRFAEKMKEVFERNGYRIVMTRTDDRSLCEGAFVKREDMNKRVQIIHNSNATLALSIHMNKFSIEKYRGAQVFYSHNNPNNVLLAETIQNNLKIYLKNTDRSIVRRDNIYLLNHVVIPCCIIECGFMSNYEELELLKSEEYQYQFAMGVLLGIESYLLMR